MRQATDKPNCFLRPSEVCSVRGNMVLLFLSLPLSEFLPGPIPQSPQTVLFNVLLLEGVTTVQLHIKLNYSFTFGR